MGGDTDGNRYTERQVEINFARRLKKGFGSHSFSNGTSGKNTTILNTSAKSLYVVGVGWGRG